MILSKYSIVKEHTSIKKYYSCINLKLKYQITRTKMGIWMDVGWGSDKYVYLYT